MKLIIKRGRQVEQRNYLGASNGVTFSLYCKVLLDEVEQILAHKYGVDQYTLSTLKCGNGGPMQVIGLLSGVTFHHTEMKNLLENEQTIKEACEELKSLLQVMALVGDEEIIEY